MPRKEPSKRAQMQYLFLCKNFIFLLCAIAFIPVIHQIIVRLFFPGIGLELVTGGVMIGVVLIGVPVSFVKANRDARRLYPVEATPQPQQNPQP